MGARAYDSDFSSASGLSGNCAATVYLVSRLPSGTTMTSSGVQILADPEPPFENIADSALAPTNFTRREAGKLRPCAIRVGAILHELRSQDEASEESPAGTEEGRRLRGQRG